MFVTVKTNDGEMAVVNPAQITHMTVASFSGAGSRIYFVSNATLGVRDTIESILQQISGDAVHPPG